MECVRDGDSKCGGDCAEIKTLNDVTETCTTCLYRIVEDKQWAVSRYLQNGTAEWSPLIWNIENPFHNDLIEMMEEFTGYPHCAFQVNCRDNDYWVVIWEKSDYEQKI